MGRRRSSTSVVLACLMMVCFQQKLPASSAAPSSAFLPGNATGDQDSAAMYYLSQYGYLDMKKGLNSTTKQLDLRVVDKAISDFQKFAGMEPSGQLDKETLKMMAMPRCGVKDVKDSRRSKRYALLGSPWRTKDLKYRITKYPESLKRSVVDSEIARAFAVWTQYTNLRFNPSNGPVHIEIRFEKGVHQDVGGRGTFDGPGGVLAHAYSPSGGGDAHFDDTEVWTVRSYRGTNLFQVAAHEFGHSLGLDHSNIQSAVMAPFYRRYEPNFKLHRDDIRGILALYGSKTRSRGRTRVWRRRFS